MASSSQGPSFESSQDDLYEGSPPQRPVQEPELPPYKHYHREPPSEGIHSSYSSPSSYRSPRRRLQLLSSQASPLPRSQAYWYKKKLFVIQNHPSNPSKLRIQCTQPSCKYFQDTKDRRVGGSGNLIRHYQSKHKLIPILEEDEKIQQLAAQPLSSLLKADFFTPRFNGDKDQKLR